MKNKLIFWIIGIVVLSNIAYAQIENDIVTNPMLNFLGIVAIVWLTMLGLHTWLAKGKPISKWMHIGTIAFGILLALTARDYFNPIEMIWGIVNVIIKIFQYLFSIGWVGLIIAAVIGLFIFTLVKGWLKIGVPLLIVLGSLALFLIIGWYYYKGDFTIIETIPDVGIGIGRPSGTAPSEGLTSEIVGLIKRYGRNDPCALYSIMWQEVGRLRRDRWSPYAISPAGAAGLTQMLPSTAALSGISAGSMYKGAEYIQKYNARYVSRTLSDSDWDRYKREYYTDFKGEKSRRISDARSRGTSIRAAMIALDKRFDPGVNVQAGARYLFSLIEKHNGDLKLAAIEYNGGGDAVRLYRQRGDSGLSGDFSETRNYYKDVLKKYEGGGFFGGKGCRDYASFDEFLRNEGYAPRVDVSPEPPPGSEPEPTPEDMSPGGGGLIPD
ncbi:transglycosylase SLT domain-containing protein [Candidatus Woesearchaeota archaeon]|nr:transglycosylase SLT domain-containing protein [Candidatus Woesearchaeota archaeon]